MKILLDAIATYKLFDFFSLPISSLQHVLF